MKKRPGLLEQKIIVLLKREGTMSAAAIVRKIVMGLARSRDYEKCRIVEERRGKYIRAAMMRLWERGTIVLGKNLNFELAP